MSDSIAWIEESPKDQQHYNKSPPEDASTESNATIVDATVFRVDPPEEDEKPIGMNEYGMSAGAIIPEHVEGQFDPFIHIPRGRWDTASSTASDPLHADDTESTSTVMTTATEDPKIYRDTDREREGGDLDEDSKILRSALLNRVRLEQASNEALYNPLDSIRSSSKYSVDPDGGISVQLYTPKEFEAQQTQDAKESTPLSSWQPTQTTQQQSDLPCVEQTLNVTIQRVPKDADNQAAEATNLNGHITLFRERQNEKLEAAKDDVGQEVKVQQFGHDVVAAQDNTLNEEIQKIYKEDQEATGFDKKPESASSEITWIQQKDDSGSGQQIGQDANFKAPDQQNNLTSGQSKSEEDQLQQIGDEKTPDDSSKQQLHVQQFGQNSVITLGQLENAAQKSDATATPDQQVDVVAEPKQNEFGTLACELRAKDDVQNSDVVQQNDVHVSDNTQHISSSAISDQQVDVVTEPKQNEPDKLACELRAKDDVQESDTQPSNNTQDFSGSTQNDAPKQHAEVHEVQFKSFPGEEYSPHELAPSISAISINQKEDRTANASPKPEKRVNFSEQLVRRYPESPTDAKSFEEDAKQLQGEDNKEPGEVGKSSNKPNSTNNVNKDEDLNQEVAGINKTSSNLPDSTHELNLEKKSVNQTPFEAQEDVSSFESRYSTNMPGDLIKVEKNASHIPETIQEENLPDATSKIDELLLEEPVKLKDSLSDLLSKFDAVQNDLTKSDGDVQVGVLKSEENQNGLDGDVQINVLKFDGDTQDLKTGEVQDGLSKSDKDAQSENLKSGEDEVLKSGEVKSEDLESGENKSEKLQADGNVQIDVLKFDGDVQTSGEPQIDTVIPATGDQNNFPKSEEAQNDVTKSAGESQPDALKPDQTDLLKQEDTPKAFPQSDAEAQSDISKPDDSNIQNIEDSQNEIPQSDGEEIQINVQKFDETQQEFPNSDTAQKELPEYDTSQNELSKTDITQTGFPKSDTAQNDVSEAAKIDQPTNELTRSDETVDVPATIKEEIRHEGEKQQNELAKSEETTDVPAKLAEEQETSIPITSDNTTVKSEDVQIPAKHEDVQTASENTQNDVHPKSEDITTSTVTEKVSDNVQPKPEETRRNSGPISGEIQVEILPKSDETQSPVKKYEAHDWIDVGGKDVTQLSPKEEIPPADNTLPEQTESAKPDTSTQQESIPTTTQFYDFEQKAAEPSDSANKWIEQAPDTQKPEQESTGISTQSDLEPKSTEPSAEWIEQPAEPVQLDQNAGQPAEQPTSNQENTTSGGDQIQWIEQTDDKPQPTVDTKQQSLPESNQQQSTVDTKQHSLSESNQPPDQQAPVSIQESSLPSEQPTDATKRESIVSWLLNKDKPKTESAQWVTPSGDVPKPADVSKTSENVEKTGGEEKSTNNEEKSDTSRPVTNQPSTSVESGQKVEETERKRDRSMDQVEVLPHDTDENRDMNAELDAYGQKLIQNTREALALVDALCQDTLERQERRKRHLTGGPLDSLGNDLSGNQLQQKVSRPPIVEFDDLEVEVYRVNPELLEEPKSCVLLPDAKLLILDTKLGLTLMDLPTKETKRCAPAEDWRDVECACYMKKHNQILLVYEQRVDDNQFHKYLARFDLQLQMLSKCEAPKYIQERVVTSCRVCYIDETDCVYLAVNTPNDCYLYELTPDCKWTEVYTMRGRNVADICKLATVGPVTELLVLDPIKRHILLLCIYNSALAERALIAFCAEPAALCVDEHDNLIAFDRATNLVGVHSRLDFERIRDLVVVGRANCSLSAREGHLALLNQLRKELRICKY